MFWYGKQTKRVCVLLKVVKKQLVASVLPTTKQGELVVVIMVSRVVFLKTFRTVLNSCFCPIKVQHAAKHSSRCD